MATKSIKTSKPASPSVKSAKTSAPKLARARRNDRAGSDEAQATHPEMQPDTATQPPRAETRPIAVSQIATRAYELWCERGYGHGQDVEDWLAAERDLIA